MWIDNIKLVAHNRSKGDDTTLKVCPYCHNDRWNFAISAAKCAYHCWVCGAHGHATQLLKYLGIDYDPSDVVATVARATQTSGPVVLPEHLLLHNQTTVHASMCMDYLLGRGMSLATQRDWHIGICTGVDPETDYNYKWHYVVPMYNYKGLVFWIAGLYTGKKRYVLPKLSKDVFAPFTRNSKTLVLVEGLFDAVAVWEHTNYDVCVLLGKTLQQSSMAQILATGYTKVVCCLDGDASTSNVKLAMQLYKAGIVSYCVALPVDKDPGDLREHLVPYLEAATIVGASTRLHSNINKFNQRVF